MFYGATSFSQDLSKWNTDKTTTCEEFAEGSACPLEEDGQHALKKTCGANLAKCVP